MAGVTPLAFAAAVFAIGVLVVVAGALGRLPDSFAERAAAGGEEIDYPAIRIGLAVLGAVSGMVLTGWLVVTAYLAAAGFVAPTMVLAKRRRREEVVRIEAIATWVESVRDTMAASAGMRQALLTSARVAPASIRPEVQSMASRLQHQSVNEALRRLAADLAHPLSDMVAASLILASTRHAGSLQEVLASTAKAARDTASMWRQVEASRARVFAQARLASWITAGMIGFLILLRRESLTAYDTFGGQVVLAIILGLYVGANYAISRIAKPPAPRRVFADIERWSELEAKVLR